MKSLALTVAPHDVETVLDAVLPLAPNGVHELQHDGHVELVLFAPDAQLPDPAEVVRGCPGLVRDAEVRDAPESWEERRLATYQPAVIAGRLVIRPDWAPATAGLVDLSLADDGAFGIGAHSTTRACVELVAGLEPGGTLADLGCGTGVVAIAAALLGWESVVAVDVDPESVAAARANAARNRTRVAVRRLDLLSDAAPPADVLVANVPLGVHESIASKLVEPPMRLVASGVGEDDAGDLVALYSGPGLSALEVQIVDGWAAALFGGAE